jgi:hypothetical protein
MPTGDSSSIAHASVTDHRIRRKPAADPPPGPAPAGTPPVVAYRAGPHAPSEKDRDRDFGLALAAALDDLPDGGDRWAVGTAAEEKLSAAVAAKGTDVEAWLALAGVHRANRDYRRMFLAARRAGELTPAGDAARAMLVAAAARTNQLDLAQTVARELVADNPGDPEYRGRLVEVLMLKRDWPGVEAAARAALAVQPVDPNARLAVAVARAKQGDAAGADRERAAAVGLLIQPDDKTWFDEQFRELTR